MGSQWDSFFNDEREKHGRFIDDIRSVRRDFLKETLENLEKYKAKFVAINSNNSSWMDEAIEKAKKDLEEFEEEEA
jgi:hypothetical protein